MTQPRYEIKEEAVRRPAKTLAFDSSSNTPAFHSHNSEARIPEVEDAQLRTDEASFYAPNDQKSLVGEFLDADSEPVNTERGESPALIGRFLDADA